MALSLDPRRPAGRWVAVLALAVIGVSLAFVFAARGSDPKPLTRDAYLSRAHILCEEYGEKLDQIPPAIDPSDLGDLLVSVTAALPILKEQAARIRALEPPAALHAQVAEFFVLTDQSISALESVRADARALKSIDVSRDLVLFNKKKTAAKLIARRIGYSC